MELALLAGRGERGLAFEIEMLLPAHFEAAGQAMRRGGQAGVGIAADHFLHVFDDGIRRPPHRRW